MTITTELGIRAARAVAIDLRATLNLAAGDLNRIKRIVKLTVLVNSAPTFTEQHLVANGASELLAQVFGESGTHARRAFGAAQVPFNRLMRVLSSRQRRSAFSRRIRSSSRSARKRLA
jgi:enamine deaminase RidA (YjgF/YER057c/UK114 family)